MSSDQISLILTGLTTITSIVLFVATVISTHYSGKMVLSEFGPKLYIYTEQILANGEWDKSIMLDFCDAVNSEIMGEGFVDSKDWYKWRLVIVNNGKAPATNIEISYSLSAYKNEFNKGVDKWYANCDDYKAVVYKKVSKKLVINYLPPDNKREFVVFYMASFPEAQLEVDLLKSSEHEFIKSKTVISRYKHPEFDFIVSPHHARKLLGLLKN